MSAQTFDDFLISHRTNAQLRAYRYLAPDWQGAEDAVQEAALHAMKAIQAGRYKPQYGYQVWFWRIVERVAIDRLRHRERRKRREVTFELMESSLFESADDLSWVDRDRLRGAMLELDDGNRELLLLRYADEWEYTELAARYHISVVAVRVRCWRARTMLKEILIGFEPEEIVTVEPAAA